MKTGRSSLKIINFAVVLLLSATVIFSAAAFSVPKTTVGAETVVNATSPGSYDQYTRNVNSALGITGTIPSDPRSGDNNFSFALQPSVSFSDITLPSNNAGVTDHGFFVDNTSATFGLDDFEDDYIFVNEAFATALARNDSLYFLFSGLTTNGNASYAEYVRISDFTKVGEWYRAPLSQWFNQSFYQSWLSLSSVRLKTINNRVPFHVSENTPPSYLHTSYRTTLDFTLRLENSDMANFRGNQYYFFDLWRTNTSGTSEQLVTRYVVYFNGTGLGNGVELGNGTCGDYVVAKKDFTYANGTLTLDPVQERAGGRMGATPLSEQLISNNYTILTAKDFVLGDDEEARKPGVTNAYTVLQGYSAPTLQFDESGDRPTITFSVETDDYDAEYRCRFGYITHKLKTYERTTFLWFTETVYELEAYRSGCIWTDAVSVADLLQSYEDGATLEARYSGDELTVANEILDDVSTQTVQLVMLEQIGDTPFAHKVTKNVTLPVRQGRLYYDTICAALGVSTLKCLNSNVESVVTVNQDGKYELVYLSAVWLHAASVSGAGYESFLNINESYETFYNRQTGFDVERDKNGRIVTGNANLGKAILTIGEYEYFLNEIKNKYPILESYTANEIYGYWGFFAIPKEYGIDAAWQYIFGSTTLYKNIAHYFRHDVSLSYEAYDALLEDYGHMYLSRLFNEVVGTALGYDATYYMVYVDDAGYAATTENGTTDPDGDGYLTNKTQEITGKVENILSGSLNWLLDLVNNNLNTVMTIALILGAGVLIVIVLVKTGALGALAKNVKSKGGKKRK